MSNKVLLYVGLGALVIALACPPEYVFVVNLARLVSVITGIVAAYRLGGSHQGKVDV